MLTVRNHWRAQRKARQILHDELVGGLVSRNLVLKTADLLLLWGQVWERFLDIGVLSEVLKEMGAYLDYLTTGA